MAIHKVAYAKVIRPDLSVRAWRDSSETRTASASNLIEKASSILGAAFDPNDYLLTHATIVCSVDTFSPGMPTGSVDFEGEKINRKYPDFRITKNTEQYINNNLDAFSRSVLLKSFRTFIGAYNFQEHVQIPSESKGKVIDAAIRDLGDTLYVDILVATSRVHKDLVSRIESGDLSTLSMGCNISFSLCTKCGNVAIDETEFCQHIRHMKGQKFIDETGEERIIAELCGHSDVNPTGGVTFIEASWVEDPAFKGAVMRNILTATKSTAKKAEKILNSPPRKWSESNSRKSASRRAFDFGDGDGESSEDGAEKSEEVDELTDAVNSVQSEIVQQALRKVRERMNKEDSKNDVSDQKLTTTNETILKEGNSRGRSTKNAFSITNRLISASASNEREFLSRTASLHRSFGISVDSMLYKAVEMNPIEQFKDPSGYIRSCNRVLNRKASRAEAKFLIHMGHQFRAFRNRNSEE